jgi:MFS family permease
MENGVIITHPHHAPPSNNKSSTMNFSLLTQNIRYKKTTSIIMEPTTDQSVVVEEIHAVFHANSKVQEEARGGDDDDTQQRMYNALQAKMANKPKSRRERTPSSLSVFLAEGIHQPDTEELITAIPDRFDKRSAKAKARWFGSHCIAGLGMFVEAFVIITTGQVKTVWKDHYPACWAPDHDVACPNNIQCCGLFPNTPTFDNGTCAVDLDDDNRGYCQENGEYPDSALCIEAVTASISYSEFAGIMVGMVVFGALLDLIGRKRAGILTSLTMTVGIGGMTFFNNKASAQTLFVVFAAFFGLFGFGVGGEYPLTASGAAEHHAVAAAAAEGDNDQDRHRKRLLLEAARTARRGETIALVFAMQGVGAVFGSMILLSLILVSNQGRVDCDHYTTNESGNDPNGLGAVWRTFYLFGLVFIIMLLLYRYLVLEEGKGYIKVQERKKRREQKMGITGWAGEFKLLRFYSRRLIGTGGCWFLTDVMFYGLKLFSGPIFANINPNGDLITNNGWLLVNNIISLFGYYGASMVLDNKRFGRRNLQLYSFAILVVIFFVTAAILDSAPTGVVMFLFFLSGFFTNFGPNTCTYLMAAETYPTELRGTMHGTSAFMGKAGALLATIVFSGKSTSQIFWICGATGIIGALVSFLFSVDLTQVSLAEHDAQLELFLEGRLDVYKGKLNAPEHLSVFEKWTGWHGDYDPLWADRLVEAEKGKGGHSSRSLGSRSLGRGVLGDDGDAVEVSASKFARHS